MAIKSYKTAFQYDFGDGSHKTVIPLKLFSVCHILPTNLFSSGLFAVSIHRPIDSDQLRSEANNPTAR